MTSTVGELVEREIERQNELFGDVGLRVTEAAKDFARQVAIETASSLQNEIDTWREAAREFRLGEPTARQRLLDALAKAEGNS